MSCCAVPRCAVVVLLISSRPSLSGVSYKGVRSSGVGRNEANAPQAKSTTDKRCCHPLTRGRNPDPRPVSDKRVVVSRTAAHHTQCRALIQTHPNNFPSPAAKCGVSGHGPSLLQPAKLCVGLPSLLPACLPCLTSKPTSLCLQLLLPPSRCCKQLQRHLPTTPSWHTVPADLPLQRNFSYTACCICGMKNKQPAG